MRKAATAIALLSAVFALSGCYRHHVGSYGDHSYHHGDHDGDHH